MKKALKYVLAEMKSAGINYHFQKYKTNEPVYPYFVGELLPVIPINEDGIKEYTLSLMGFHRGSLIELLEEVDKIEEIFPCIGGSRTVIDNESVAVFFDTCQPIDSMMEGVEKVLVNLTIKTLKGRS